MDINKINDLIACLEENNNKQLGLGEKEKKVAQNILNELKGYRIIGATKILEFCIEALQCMYVDD